MLERVREAIQAIINLLMFLFIVTGFVHTVFVKRSDAGINGYIDALCLTVTTITTTGFGDIALPGTGGKLASIVIMNFGISLFFRLAQAILRPTKVQQPCPQCGLQRHDPDAVHCKACGDMINIPNHGQH